MTKLQWVQDQLTKFYNDEETKKWIQHLLDSPLDIDKVKSMVLYELHESYKNNLKKVQIKFGFLRTIVLLFIIDLIASGISLFFDQSPPPITFPALAVAIPHLFEKKLL